MLKTDLPLALLPVRLETRVVAGGTHSSSASIPTSSTSTRSSPN